MRSPARWLPSAILTIAVGCATIDRGSGGPINLRPPLAVDGDPQALAWPFQVATNATLSGFRLRLDAGGTLVAVRPDSANPEPAAPGWTGSHRDGEAVWSGPSRGQPVPLTIMVRAEAPGTQQLRVRYMHQSNGDASSWTCERWTYRVSDARIERGGC